MVKASGNFSPITFGEPRLETTALNNLKVFRLEEIDRGVSYICGAVHERVIVSNGASLAIRMSEVSISGGTAQTGADDPFLLTLESPFPKCLNK